MKPFLVKAHRGKQCELCGGSGIIRVRLLFWHLQRLCPRREHIITHLDWYGYNWPWNDWRK